MIELAPSKQQNVNKNPKFKDNFDIWRQLEHFEYGMNLSLIFNTESESKYPPKVYIETNLHVAKDFGKHIV